jgi:hypothetical protein
MMMVDAFIWYVAGQAGTEHGRGVLPPSFPHEDAGWADARGAAGARRRRRRRRGLRRGIWGSSARVLI